MENDEKTIGSPEMTSATTPVPTQPGTTPNLETVLSELRNWTVPKVACTFGGLKVSDEYGTVIVALDGRDYRVRCGTREWHAAEKRFDVQTLNAVVTRAQRDEESMTEFYRILLSREHKDIALEDVMDLMDWRGPAGTATLKDAVELSLHYSKPAVFPDEETDPKALAAMQERVKILLETILSAVGGTSA